MIKFAFVFPGQSSQRIGMLQELHRESEEVRRTFEEASDLLHLNVAGLCFEGDESTLRDIRISAPLIVTACTASFRHFTAERAERPALMAGHSLGEYAALSCAGVLTFEQALKTVTFRSELAHEAAIACDGAMSVIYRTDANVIEQRCAELRRQGKRVWVSCFNAPDQLSVAGVRADLDLLERIAEERGASVKRMAGNAPFHTPLLQEASVELGAHLRALKLSEPKYPVIANVNLNCYTADTVADYLVAQLLSPVQWHRTIERALRQNVDTFVELGSGGILTRMLRASYPDARAFGYERQAERDRLAGLFPVREAVPQ